VKTEEGSGGSWQRSNDENSRELQQMMRDSEALLGLPAHTEDNRPVASPDFGKQTEIEFQTFKFEILVMKLVAFSLFSL
jgi:hypothetical protein